ncbi:MAG: exonuclease SbcCD subunit D [Armatimonadetes bacterium]|nr:exonuclease SbcCD subunit D [Armatimonadota bacterium]
MALRLLHLADTHIGVETYGRIDPATGRHTRLQDFADSLNKAVDLGLDAKVDACLFAGDAYRTCYPSPTHQQVFAAAMGRLVAAGVPIVMVAGNHDLPVAFGRATSLDIFKTLTGERVQVATRPGLCRVETAAGPLQVACLPWPTMAVLRAADQAVSRTDDETRRELERLCEEAIASQAAELDAAVPAVLLGHITAADAVFAGSEQVALRGGDVTLSRGVLANSRFDYVALGHIHRFQDLNQGHRPAVVYPGSIDRIDFAEANDPKGVCLVTIGDGASPAERETRYEHCLLPVRPFLPISLAVPPEAEITPWMTARLAPLRLDGAVVRIRYSCTDEQYGNLDLPEVRRAVDWAHLVAGVIRERPRQEVRPRVEVTEQQTVAEALARYLDTRPELQPWREDLVALSAEIERELTASEAEAEEPAG